jgi:uncharacterized protein (TIGR04141 family)
MSKSRSFSIYLLKEGFSEATALKEDTKLEAGVAAGKLPSESTLHILDSPEYAPWWVEFFGVRKELRQSSKGAIVFLLTGGRCFALCFGHVSHNLREESYEYDFGLRVTLNCVDPDKLRSTDTLQPSGSKRQRTQLPTAGDLTFFDVDLDSTILKSLTGKVRDAHKTIFSNATGSSNIRISSSLSSVELSNLCNALLGLYRDNSYKSSFPDIQNISPVRDPAIITKLNGTLLEAVRERGNDLALSVPDLVDFKDGLWGSFSGSGPGKVYDDVFIDRYYDYVRGVGINTEDIDLSTLRRHELLLTNDDGSVVRARYSLFKCLVFDTVLSSSSESYHFCEGNWYLVDRAYVARLKHFLDPLCQDTTLPDFNHVDEGSYNIAVAEATLGRICLDKKSITPDGQKQVEPCDVYEVIDDVAVLHCVKISTLSAQLSHLFNQGTNSVSLMRSEPDSLNRMKLLVSESASESERDALIAPLDSNKFRVVFGIVTHKDKSAKSDNLPLFSRISLMRCMRDLKRMGVPAEYCFIPDKSTKSDGRKRRRKKKSGSP